MFKHKKTVARYAALVMCVVGTLHLTSCGQRDATNPVGSVAHTPKQLKQYFKIESGTPNEDAFSYPYPNPFSAVSGETGITFSFSNAQTSKALLLIQNPLGDQIVTFIDTLLPPGQMQGVWTPNAADGTPLNPGLYFATLHLTDSTGTDRFVASRLIQILNNFEPYVIIRLNGFVQA